MPALAKHHLAATVTSSRDFIPLTGIHKPATSFLLVQYSNSFVQLTGPYPTSHIQESSSQPWGHSSRRQHSYANTKCKHRYLCTAHLAPASDTAQQPTSATCLRQTQAHLRRHKNFPPTSCSHRHCRMDAGKRCRGEVPCVAWFMLRGEGRPNCWCKHTLRLCSQHLALSKSKPYVASN